MTGEDRSQNVCYACMSRKKACDKALPACSFCASRQLVCRYDISAPKSNGRRKYNPGRHFVPVQSPSPTTVSSDGSWVGQSSVVDDGQNHTPVHCILSLGAKDSIPQLAQYLLQLTQLTRANVIDRYFQISHKWFPLVSPDRFRQDESLYGEEKLSPPDHMMLFLAMLLIILPDLDHSLCPPLSTQALIYRAIKSALALCQASHSPSLRLVQASLLIALREYTCVRPEAAYISVMTCVGLKRIMEITSSTSKGNVQNSYDTRQEAEEIKNLALMTALLERLILCELSGSKLRPQTELPRPNTTSRNGSDATIVTQFPEQADSVSLLDRLLSAMRLTASKEATKVAELAELDGEIRRFLETVAAEIEIEHTRTCVRIAVRHRLLFLLHRAVLETTQQAQSEAAFQRRAIAYTGLDVVSRMTLDIANWHGQDEAAHFIPICGFYNLRQARERMQERNKFEGEDLLTRDIDSLMRAEVKYCQTWVF